MQGLLGDVQLGDFVQEARGVDAQEEGVHTGGRRVHMRGVRLQDAEEEPVCGSLGEEARNLVEETAEQHAVPLRCLRFRVQVETLVAVALHSKAHRPVRAPVQVLPEEIQGEGRSDESRAIPSQGEADQLRRLRETVPEQRLPLRAPEVGALQAQVRVSHMQTTHGHAGESRPTSADAARETGEDRVRRMREDVHEEGFVQEAHGGAHGLQATFLPDLQQTVRQEVSAASTLAHPHGQEAVRLRHLRQGFHAETWTDLSQEDSPRASSSVARHADRRYRERVHRGLRPGDKRARERGEARGGSVGLFHVFVDLSISRHFDICTRQNVTFLGRRD